MKEKVQKRKTRLDLAADFIAGTIKKAEESVGQRVSQTRGFFFTASDGGYYHFDGADKRVRRLLDGRLVGVEFASVLTRRYGLKLHEPITRLVVDALIGIAAAYPTRHVVQRFSYYMPTTNTLYLSRYNGMVYKVTADSVTEEPNGKSVFFADDDPGEPVDADVADHGLIKKLLLDDINFDDDTEGGLNRSAQQLLLDIWIHALPFVEILPTRPLLLFEGDPGAGKSATVKRVQLLVTGRPDPWLLTKQTSLEDLAVGLMRRRIAMIDNLDSWIEWLPDVLAGQATGIGFPRRKRFTDSDAADLTNNAFLAITSHDPKSLYRADVVDRTIVLRVRRRDAYIGEAAVMKRISDARPKLYGEWLAGLSCILAHLPDLDSVPSQQSRMADFAQLAFVIGRALGYDDERVEEALMLAQAERESFQGESDSMVDLIDWWLQLKGKAHNALPARKLHTEWHNNPEHEYRFKSAGSLERWLRTSAGALSRRFYFKVIETGGDAMYEFGRKEV